MNRWRRVVRYGLATFTIVFGVVVYLAIGSRQPPAATEIVERADPSAVIESTGAIVTQAKGASRDFRIEAARQLTYADGRTRLEDVHISVAERAGRSFEVTGRSADVGPNRATIELDGDVRIADDKGLTATTQHALFTEETGLLRIPGPVQFSQGRLHGSGRGAIYNRNRDLLRLQRDAVITIDADETGRGMTHVTANHAVMARADGFMRFEGDASIVRDTQLIEAQAVHAYFSGPDQRISLVELRGGSRVMPRGENVGLTHAMSAHDMDLVYGDEGQALRKATLMGNASIDVAGDAGAAGRRVAANYLVLDLGDDGTTVEAMDGRGNVRLEFDATATGSSRRIRAARLEGSGTAGEGLSSLLLTGGVEQRESGNERADRVVTARELTLEVAPGLGDVQEATFVNDVEFDEGTLSGSADLARYNVSDETMVLAMPAQPEEAADEVDDPAASAAGKATTTGSGSLGATVDETAPSAPERRPVVRDDRAVIEANEIEVSTSGGRLVAKSDVKTVMQPPGSSGQNGVRSSMLRDSTPVYVTASHLEYERDDGRAVYTGTARLWQGATTMQGDTITIDDQSGDLSADGAARSAMLLTKRDAVAESTERPPGGAAGQDEKGLVEVSSLATAEALRYDESERRITYVGKPPDVPAEPATPPPATAAGKPAAPPPWTPAHVTGPQGDLRAHKIELYLAEDGSTLERVEAYGEVRLQTEFVPSSAQPADRDGAAEPKREKRNAVGERLTYFAADERYLMHGTPVQIVERCRETHGKSLTFFKSVDTITVDGNEEIRTISRADDVCPEPPSN